MSGVMSGVASLIPPITLDYRVFETEKTKTDMRGRALAYMALALKEKRGHAWLAWLLR